MALVLLVALALSATSCVTNPVTGKSEFTLMPESEEIRLGAEADKELRAQMGVYDNAMLQQYVTGVGMRLAAAGPRPGLPWHFAVVDVADINAFALPGGYVYITRGLLAYLDTEAEMAGVLGHEIGHVNARHSAQGYTRAITLNLGAILTSVLWPKAAPYAIGAAVGLSILFLKYDRSQELQADRLGAQYASKVGWAPKGMEGVLEAISRLEASTDRRGIPNWLSTHPPTPDRIAKIDPEVQTLAASRPESEWTENREPYLSQIDGMMYGENPREGLVRGSEFVHPDMGFKVRFPDGWKIVNGKREVVASAPGDEQAQMTLTLVATPAGSSLEAVAVKAMTDLGFELLRGDLSTLNGMPAFLGTYEGTVPDVGIVRMQAAHVSKERQVIMLGGLTVRSKYSELRQAFSDTIASFSSLSRGEAAGITPNRLTFSTVREGEGWETIAKRTGGVVSAKRLAILNGFAPADPPQSGRRIKIVVKGQ
jgi:predicted Zn-dependent protease